MELVNPVCSVKRVLPWSVKLFLQQVYDVHQRLYYHGVSINWPFNVWDETMEHEDEEDDLAIIITSCHSQSADYITQKALQVPH